MIKPSNIIISLKMWYNHMSTFLLHNTIQLLAQLFLPQIRWWHPDITIWFAWGYWFNHDIRSGVYLYYLTLDGVLWTVISLCYTNISGHERLWLKLWARGDCNCAILLRGCAPQQNSTIAVTEGPSVLTQRLEWRSYIFVLYTAYLMIEGASTIVVYGKHIFSL